MIHKHTLINHFAIKMKQEEEEEEGVWSVHASSGVAGVVDKELC